MKLKVLLSIVFFIFITKVTANQPTQYSSSENSPNTEQINPDSLMHGLFSDTISKPKIPSLNINTTINANEKKAIVLPAQSKIVDKPIEQVDTIVPFIIPTRPIQVRIDSLLFLANPFFIELVYKGLPFDFNWNIQPDFKELYYGRKATTLYGYQLVPVIHKSAEQIIAELRQYAQEQIIRNAANLYVMTFDELPDPEIYKSHKIEGKSINKQWVITDDLTLRRRRLVVRREQLGPWQHGAKADAQFSQNYVSSNWYQGGFSNLAILGIITGHMNYDNKKGIQWENRGEWRMGFNSIAGDTLHALSTNDDVFKINSKLGIKASGNWFYSGSVDFSTQFFNSYNGVNSTIMKATFLTPVRFNVGVGLDYKYKKIFSVMLAPVSYKYIYVQDSRNVDPNLFGIKTGKRVLSEIGSSFNSTFCYSPTREIQIDSKLNFYTNYQSVVIDWEVVCNMVINRFMSTRISLNPRYDTSAILAPGESPAKPQFKQLLSVGFSHKFY